MSLFRRRINRDYVPLSLIAACLVIWLSAKPWQTQEAIAIAGDIVKVCFGGILGYLAKDAIDKPQREESETAIADLSAENQQLKDEIEALKQVNGI